MRNDEQQPTDQQNADTTPTTPAATDKQTGAGLDQNFDQIDLEGASDVGADPPGGPGTAISSADPIGEDEQAGDQL